MLKNNLLHYAILVAIMLLFTYELTVFIQTDQVVAKSLSEKYTQDVIAKYLDMRHQWSWIGYVFVPVALFLSTSLTALVILLVIELYYVHDTNLKIKFKDTWRIVLTAQWCSVASILIKTIWFGFFHTKYSMEELQSFSPLSVINLFDVNSMNKLFVYPIQLLNVFELAYWIVLIIGIKKLMQMSWMRSFQLVFFSYGMTLILWIVVAMFITLNFS